MKKHILLIITGSIAAYKALEFISILKEKNYKVTSILTESAKKFITPLSVAALSHSNVYHDLFSLDGNNKIGHIELSRQADFIVVMPASANIISRAANGLADDIATNVLLASNKPIYIVPAMNVYMWEHPATQANVKKLQEYGYHIIGPDRGKLTCGEEGLGKMMDVHDIITKLPLDIDV